eukprot:CAMPEP_0194421462 /NCGR_PEP_ID=MMETSP0176-20130528/20686_1 /TAXON_ID=216777 /ORGANISM="Proboscia alata, Strain PI-D3" /LENGTH=194 /DNA_ID=CAMNT_0039229575 /DNA_START=20 /DNA_END=601 /DNA_ORIENTATION=+
MWPSRVRSAWNPWRISCLLLLLSTLQCTVRSTSTSTSNRKPRPSYIGPRDRFWRHHAVHQTLIIDGVEHYQTLHTCLHTSPNLTPDDFHSLSLIPSNRTIGRTILENPDSKFGNVVLVEIVNAMTPIHVLAVQTLASCIRTHIPSLHETRPMYLELGYDIDPGLGGNSPTHLAPLIGIFLPEVVEDMFRVMELA